RAGDAVQYYFKLPYSDRQTTFLHGSDTRSLRTGSEAAARGAPFVFQVRPALRPQGLVLSFASGPLEARLFRDTGHVALAGPDLDHSYKAAPWFLSTRGYGFHLDSSAESDFDLRHSAADRYVVTNHFSSLRYNVVFGPRLPDVLTRFTAYAGRPALPPPWAF